MIPGPKSQALVAREAKLLAPGVQQIATLGGIALERGQGALLYDVDGNAYIDFVAGVCVNSVGTAHPRYVAALQAQVAALSVGSFTSAPRVELLELLARITPGAGQLNRVQLYSSGAEAVEAAIRLARAHTGHFEVLSFWGGFHGKTGGVLGLLGGSFKHDHGPLHPGLYLTPYPAGFRGPFHELPPAERMARCLELLEQKLDAETTRSLAAIIVEPAQGTAGNVFAPIGFLSALKAICERRGALLIADEMITGFGRTGRMFASERDPVVPHLMTIGKGFGAGFPVTGVITSDAICGAEPWALPSGSSSSYGGNPLAAAAALAATRIVVEEDLPQNARVKGQLFLELLRPCVERYSFVGEVRGEGLMIGIEFVAGRGQRAPLPQAMCREIFTGCLRRGLITMAYSPALRINPPLVINRELVERGVAILREVFDEIEERHFS